MLLTLLAHEGKIWNVYVAAVGAGDPGGPMTLQFERVAEEAGLVRFARPVAGALLEALRAGASVSRDSLRAELDLALREGPLPNDALEVGARMRPWRDLDHDDW